MFNSQEYVADIKKPKLSRKQKASNKLLKSDEVEMRLKVEVDMSDELISVDNIDDDSMSTLTPPAQASLSNIHTDNPLLFDTESDAGATEVSLLSMDMLDQSSITHSVDMKQIDWACDTKQLYDCLPDSVSCSAEDSQSSIASDKTNNFVGREENHVEMISGESQSVERQDQQNSTCSAMFPHSDMDFKLHERLSPSDLLMDTNTPTDSIQSPQSQDVSGTCDALVIALYIL